MAFSLGWGPIPMLVMSEITPVKARGTASAITVVVAWLSSFIVTKVFFSVSASYIFTACKRSLRRLCFYTCLSVILYMGGGVCLSACWDSRLPPPEQTYPWEQTSPQEQTPPPGADSPLTQCMLGDTANKRAVRILLECILV